MPRGKGGPLLHCLSRPHAMRNHHGLLMRCSYAGGIDVSYSDSSLSRITIVVGRPYLAEATKMWQRGDSTTVEFPIRFASSETWQYLRDALAQFKQETGIDLHDDAAAAAYLFSGLENVEDEKAMTATRTTTVTFRQDSDGWHLAR